MSEVDKAREGPMLDRDIESLSNPNGSTGAVQKMRLLYKVIFIVTGCFELFYWNNVLSILYNIRRDIYPEYPSMTDTINAVNTLAQLIVCLYMVYTGAMNQKMVLGAGFCMLLLSLATAGTVQWLGGMAGVVVIHILSFLNGGLTGVFQAGAYGLASSMPRSMAGYVSTGDGLCGVLSFALWMIVSNTSMSTKAGTWLLMSVSAASGIISLGAYLHLIQKPDVAKRVEENQRRLKNEATDPDAPGYRMLFGQCWIHIVGMWVNFFITLFIFPNIGPLKWNEGDNTNYVMGAFQVGDLIGRYTPNVIKTDKVSANGVIAIVTGRLIFLPLGLIIWHFQTNAFWNNIWLHLIVMLLLAVTTGATTTTILMNGPRLIKEESWRSRVSSMIIVALQLGICSGLWTARLFTALTD